VATTESHQAALPGEGRDKYEQVTSRRSGRLQTHANHTTKLSGAFAEAGSSYCIGFRTTAAHHTTPRACGRGQGEEGLLLHCHVASRPTILVGVLFRVGSCRHFVFVMLGFRGLHPHKRRCSDHITTFITSYTHPFPSSAVSRACFSIAHGGGE
jgi:hypothetical protein